MGWVCKPILVLSFSSSLKIHPFELVGEKVNPIAAIFVFDIQEKSFKAAPAKGDGEGMVGGRGWLY